MALPLLRRLYLCRLPSLVHRARHLTPGHLALVRSSKTQLLSVGTVSSTRCYSSSTSDGPEVLMGPNIFILIRMRLYFFLIRSYFDKEFSMKEFVQGANQAFFHVSRILSECRFEALEGLVAKDLVGKLEDKCNLLPANHKQALFASPDNIVYVMPSDVGIYYDDNERKFVSILMRFWYMTSAKLPDDTFVVEVKDEEPTQMLTALYEFQREFTKDVVADWTITRIEHSKLLD